MHMFLHARIAFLIMLDFSFAQPAVSDHIALIAQASAMH